MRLLAPYIMLSLIAFGCLGLCLVEWLICLFAGGWADTLGVPSCGRKVVPLASCGAYGEK